MWTRSVHAETIKYVKLSRNVLWQNNIFMELPLRKAEQNTGELYEAEEIQIHLSLWREGKSKNNQNEY